MTQTFLKAPSENSAGHILISSENPSDFIHFETLRFFENALLGGLIVNARVNSQTILFRMEENTFYEALLNTIILLLQSANPKGEFKEKFHSIL